MKKMIATALFLFSGFISITFFDSLLMEGVEDRYGKKLYIIFQVIFGLFLYEIFLLLLIKNNEKLKFAVGMLVGLCILILMGFFVESKISTYKDIGKIKNLPLEIQSKINLEYYKSIPSIEYGDFGVKKVITHTSGCMESSTSFYYEELYEKWTGDKLYDMNFEHENKVNAEILGIEKKGELLIIKERIENIGRHINSYCAQSGYHFNFYYGPKLAISIFDLAEGKIVFRKIIAEFNLDGDSNNRKPLRNQNSLEAEQLKIVLEEVGVSKIMIPHTMGKNLWLHSNEE